MLLSARLAAAGALGLLSLGGWLFARKADPPAPAHAVGGGGVPVVVEVFSSEGCSSCPPADEYLARLDRTQPIDGVTVVALEEHVDYWDRLGWKDPFGNAAFGDRQSAYARVLEDSRVYTPEVIIDGHAVVEGGDEDEARRMMQASAREPKAHVTVAKTASGVTVDVSDTPAASPEEGAEVWLAVTESGLTTDVPRGENAGRRLSHGPIVRSLQRLGTLSGPTFHAERPLTLHGERVVVFVQRAKTRRIVGVGAL